MGHHSQYNDWDLHWKIWDSKVGISKRTISSHNIQTTSSTHHASNSMKTTTISLAVKWPEQTSWPLSTLWSQVYKSVKLYLHSTGLPPWHIVGQLYFTFTSYLCTSLSRGRILSGLTKEPFYTVLIWYMQTTLSIYFTSFDLITLTSWRVPITNLII